mgnify:CR=1 FL=1
MGKPFEYIGALQCENRILRKKVADYESGERFQWNIKKYLMSTADR